MIEKLQNGEKLDQKYLNHKLICNYKEYRECHIGYNLILLYKINKKKNELELYRVGSHRSIYGW